VTLPPLAPEEFAPIFEAIHDAPPFPWQHRLASRLAAGESWPDALDLPTGSGKTAALDIALFHLALEADRGVQRQAPVRIAFIVDRRIIVDAAADRAERIARALAEATGNDACARMAQRLRHLAGQDAPPVMVRRLRGGLPREEDWARSPSQPVILCSTVDQVGSRLLFRGYGISDSMKPVHAGLLGSDALLLLDEAHLAAPFAQTLGWVSRYRTQPWSAEAPGPWQFVTLSATPGEAAAQFGLEEEDRCNPVLGRRLKAAKPTRLRVVDGTTELGKRAAPFAQAMLDLNDEATPRRIAVVVNRVALARAVFEALREKLADEADVVLLTGRMRGLDRDALMQEFSPRLVLGASPPDRTLVVVATQTIEAGADFDFDALVTQAAPLDSLRQRFGRLNRAGREYDARAIIIAAKDEISARPDDPIYGDRTRATWQWLTSKAGKARKGAEQTLDFGIEALGQLLAAEPDKTVTLSAERPQAPILRPADVLLLSWTAPVPAVDPAVTLFLHGPQSGPADVSIVWRADITEESLAAAAAWIALAPPHPGETLQMPIWAAQAWLSGQEAQASNLADLEGLRAQGDDREAEKRPRLALRWAGEGQEATCVVRPADLRPGDVIIVPATYGGCDRFGWHPGSEEPVTDLGDRDGCVMRLHAELAGDAWPSIAAVIADDEDRDNAELLKALAESGVIPRERAWRLHRPEGYGGMILVARQPGGLVAATEDDAAGSRAPRSVLLSDHAKAVETKARAFALSAGLSPARAEDIALAARWHDAGKADPRFQAMLCGGDRILAAIRADAPLAKSATAPDTLAAEHARRAAGLPARWRHEAHSVTRAIVARAVDGAADPELVLWLIGTHHGHGRPLFPHHDPREPPSALGPQRLDFQFEGHDWPQLFERLKDRYGPWELARIEAVLRLADHRASEEAGG
jgi:CRISPR-associated endonuclease/helicase Cas3